jgi:succinate dehydrogenase / fumarate reductase iron-sulfur subunit
VPAGSAAKALFTGAKVAHLGLLPQGQPERLERVLGMVDQGRQEGFGHCTTIGECEAVCPAHVPLEVIAQMNRDFIKASLTVREAAAETGA